MSEYLFRYKTSYKYSMAIDFNTNPVVYGKGSAIFLHCQTKNKFTAGCVAIPEEAMITVMKNVKAGCVVIMDTSKNIKSY